MANWDDMRIFLAVARAESLSAAAPALKMDPATLGRRIARLEAATGAALFVKSPQGYALTDLGGRMMEAASQAEIALRRAADLGQSPDSGLAGQIRIGAPDGCANYLLPQVCAAIQQANPDLEVQILALPRTVNLSRREADMAITVSPPQTGRLTVQKISDYRLHLAQHRDLPVPASLADVKGRAVVGYIPDMIFDTALDYLGALATDGVQMASNSVSVQLQMLRARSGIGVAHDFALPFAPDVRSVLRDQLSLVRSFYLVRHTADRRSDRLNRFAVALVDGLRHEVSRLESLTDAAAS